MAYIMARKVASKMSPRAKCSVIGILLNLLLCIELFFIGIFQLHAWVTLSNVDDGETVTTPVTTVLLLQNLMDANKFLVLFNVI